LDAAGLSIPFPQLELWFRNRLETAAAAAIHGAAGNGNGEPAGAAVRA
jgi:small-conductance mechanosensitive channel